MLVNPILIVLSLALIVLLLFYCIVNRPKKPIMTLLFIVLLVIFITCTSILNNALTPNQEMIFGNSWQKLVPFITSVKYPTLEQCEQSFRAFQVIDICLFVAAIAAMITEVWLILVKPDKKKGG